MQRITISIDENLGEAFDAMIQARGYRSRSEGVRDLVRDAVEGWRSKYPGDTLCVASLSYLYNRQIRSLAQRLSEMRHEAHDLVVATTQMLMDHDHTLESVLMRGRADTVRAFADMVCAERGVRFGALNLVGVDTSEAHHHPHASSHETHSHLSPRPG